MAFIIEGVAVSPRLNEQLIAESETAIGAVQAVVGERGSVTTGVVKGELSRTVLEHADDHYFDMTAMWRTVERDRIAILREP
ncbi:hypothetical protein [Halostella salina]|uniref:hypothetical protein n=1 Tax=Halostella salina TaxID=1547897 RepID=UPI0013CE9BAC|nr:hypothetical protein [Halostella salina]